MNTSQIKKIGSEIRDAIYCLIGKNPDLTNHINIPDLSGGCGIASYAFSERAKSLNYKADFVVGGWKNSFNRHCWVEMGGFIIDLTATQFNKKAGLIEIYHTNSEQGSKYLEEEYNDNALYSIRYWDEQYPLNYNYQWNNDILTINRI